MTPFYEISMAFRSLFGLWSVLLCLACIISIIMSFGLKRYRCILLTIPVFILSFFIWQVIVDLQCFEGAKYAGAVSRSRGTFSLQIWAAVLLAVTIPAVLLIIRNVIYIRTCITPLAIKQCADRITCGICYWRDNGRVIFSNHCMDRLSFELTGGPLLNGRSFMDAVSGGMVNIRSEVWQFNCRDIEFDGGTLHEILAWDVTEMNEKAEKLRSDNEKLSSINEELRSYSIRIDDIVRRQEILQAKVSIHDEMNRLMLSTMAVDPDNGDELDRIFVKWQRDALLLCMEAEEKMEQNAVIQFEQMARTLGIKLIWPGELPQYISDKGRELFFIAAREAAVNAVKHAHAESLGISFEETEEKICCRFENSGLMPAGDVTFSGGLQNLSIIAKEQKASVSVNIGKTFLLTLCLKK